MSNGSNAIINLHTHTEVVTNSNRVNRRAYIEHKKKNNNQKSQYCEKHQAHIEIMSYAKDENGNNITEESQKQVIQDGYLKF